MAETGPAAIVAALTRAIADDGRGGGATLGGGAPLCPRRRWSCRRVMPEEELVGVVSAARCEVVTPGEASEGSVVAPDAAAAAERGVRRRLWGQVGRRPRTRAATTPPRSASRRRRLARAPQVAGSRIHVSCSPKIDRAPGWRGRSRFVVAGANTVSWWVLGPPPPPPSPSATRLAARG
ncbi:uncharacterized protein LOC127764754 [Oryza glaberrima]|uniref:uncharacterized protein LOC127764754 n=1 Tax=Oryza glaberrima TaxID=4538 RepID=UPI00224BFE06|nr:uncharacterized protein LOC127764754 [Oryza glaberrima]